MWWQEGVSVDVVVVPKHCALKEKGVHGCKSPLILLYPWKQGCDAGLVRYKSVSTRDHIPAAIACSVTAFKMVLCDKTCFLKDSGVQLKLLRHWAKEVLVVYMCHLFVFTHAPILSAHLSQH
jgi:hypothetical protein